MSDSLKSIQDAWLAALQDPQQQQTTEGVVMDLNAGVRDAAQGFAIYVNNVRATLIQALSQSYPVTLALLTRPMFCRAVLHSLQHYPPRQADLGQYGADFSKSVKAILDDADTRAGLITEVARCEWLIDQLPRHPRESALTTADLQAISSQHWPGLQLRLATQAMLFESWETVYAALAAARDSGEPETLNYCLLPPGKTDVDADGDTFLKQFLIVATDGQANILPLSAAEYLWLSSLGTGLALEQATDRVLRQWPDFDLLPLLIQLLSAEALVLTRPD